MKRFWKTVSVERAAEGWRVLLDGRPVNTPAKRPCVVPVEAMATAIAAEWDAQDGEVRPLAMPMTRTVATCLDRVAPEMAAVRQAVSSYGGSDLLCYRAEHPPALAARQMRAWDPVLDWAAEVLGARLRTGQGVMHIAQPPGAVATLDAEVGRLDAWALTGLADLATISGSLVLALGVLHRRFDAPEAWRLARIDEDWNVAQWGEDTEATALAARREADFLHAAGVLLLLGH